MTEERFIHPDAAFVYNTWSEVLYNYYCMSAVTAEDTFDKVYMLTLASLANLWPDCPGGPQDLPEKPWPGPRGQDQTLVASVCPHHGNTGLER